MATVLRMELLKLLKRPMTWVLTVLLHGGVGLFAVLAFLELRGDPPDARDEILRNGTLPAILPITTQLLYILGTIALAILAASSIGSEYNWGTLRPMLATGLARGRFLAAKLLALALVAVACVVVPLLMNAALAVLFAFLHDRPIVATTVDLAWLGDLAAMVGRTYLIVLVPTLIAFLIGLAGRSPAAGIGAALGLMLGQGLVGSLLLEFGPDWARAVVKLFPQQTSMVLLEHYNDFGPVATPPGVLSEGRALLTLGVYSVACLIVAFLIFQRRDIRGAA